MQKPAILLFSVLLLTACNLPIQEVGNVPLLDKEPPATEAPLQPRLCAWMWATQLLPELGQEVQARLEAAGLENISVIAEAYGENCIDSQTNEVTSFAAMETDFRISVEVKDLSDRAALGETLEKILSVLNTFSPEETPGPQPGYIGIRFFQQSDELNLWFTVQDGEVARGKGLHGAELLEDLMNR